jgi:prepilin-type N-terminal cleavage/methylation domain-containing protein
MNHLDIRSERGFTLIELMVATALGLIVSTATLAIVISSVHLTSNYSDRVDATQEGREAMQRITQQLNSSCVASGTAPILSTSDANDVWFYSALSDSPTVQPSKVEISYTSGSLVMNTYAYSSGTSPASWTFSSTAASSVLLPNAEQYNSTPIFQYYGYGSNGVLSSTPYTLGPTLGTSAATTAEVVITYQAEPTDNFTALGRPASFTDAVVLRLSPASGSTSNLPCS